MRFPFQSKGNAPRPARLGIWAVLYCMVVLFPAGSALFAQEAVPPQSLTITGVVSSGNTPIPGATVTATSSSTGKSVVTWTDMGGNYSLPVPSAGNYAVRAEMIAFAPVTRQITAADSSTRADFVLLLSSRAQAAAAPQEPRRTVARESRGFQSLAVLQGLANGDTANNGPADQIVPSGMPVPGIAPDSATESIAYSGNNSGVTMSMTMDEMQQRMRDSQGQGGFGGGTTTGGPGGGGPGGGPGGGGPGGVGFGFGGPPGGGPRGGGGPFVLGGGRGRFDINRPHGSVYYTLGDSALNAAPYSLTGNPLLKPGYLQQKFGVSFGGPLNIPRIYHGGTKTFFFFNYNGSRSDNPYDSFSTVPTSDERNGDFSQSTFVSRDSSGNSVRLPVQIFYPSTSPCPEAGQPIPGNNLQNFNPACSLNPAAQGIAQNLLKFIPTPNLPGVQPDEQNFHFITTATSNSDDLNIRLMHALGGASVGSRRARGPQNNLTFGFHYHGANSVLTNPFPTVGGNTSTRSFDVPVGYIRSFGKLTNVFRVDYNRSRTSTQNLYAFSQNIAGDLGIGGVSSDPFDWGLPNLSFTHFGSLSDTNPRLVRNQTYTFTDNLIWTHGKHTLHWGGDFRRIQLNTEASNDARGTFVFTGLNTSQNGALNTGFDLADFLLGLPQQTQLQKALQTGDNNYHFRGNFWDLYAQDEWKLRSNLTLNLGVRYEYVSPFTELNDRIANLDIAPEFFVNPNFNPSTAVVPVLPGGIGPNNGAYPASLARPDRNNLAPRIGIAWKALPKTVVRTGYGINYNTGAYQTIVQQLAFQPPFAVTATNVQSDASEAGAFTLQCGFPPANSCGSPPASGQITNNYAVDPNYRLGYVQIWNLDVQQEVTPTLIFNLDYTGTKGTRLDVLEAPNRCLVGDPNQPNCTTGIRLGNVQAFNWESSQADSTANAGTIRLRKRLQHGVSIGGSYTYSKSIDDSSSIGGTASVVAQNPFDLPGERGLSIFDQRHKLTADYLWQLPFGHDRHWLNGSGRLRDVFGDWQWSGDFTIASGLPFTPRVLGNFADVSQGTNGTLRADVVPGQPVTVPDPSISEWFNTAAFVVPPSNQYGDARRNSIEGPGTFLFDMAVTRVVPIREGRMLELRMQASNVFNHPQYASIDTTVNSPTFGRVIAVGAMRTLQFTARFRF